MTAPTPEARLARFIVPAPEGVTYYSRCCGPTVALSPDGEWLVFVGGGGGEGRSPLYRRRLGQLEAEEIPGTDDGSIPFFSPDGRWLGFYSDGRLRKVPMTGGPPVPIAEIERAEGASWGDNDVIVLSDNSALFTVPAGGGVPTIVPGTDSLRYIHPTMLPGGKAAVVRFGTPSDDARLLAVDLETGSADTIGFGTYGAYAMGHLVYSGADGTLLAQPFDPKKRRTTGRSVAILDGVRLAGPGVGEFALSTHGGLAYQPGGASGNEALAIVESSGGSTRLELPERGNLENPSISPDGQRVALRFTDVGQRQDIWIYDMDQGTMPNLTVEGARNVAPVWTKDGSRVTFASNRDGGRQQLYWKPSDGSGTAERLLTSDYAAIPGSWFPDGRTLAFMGQREGNWDIGFLTIGDSTPRWAVESEFDEMLPQVSPDGQWLAYASDRSGDTEIYVEAASGEGGRFPVSTNGGWAPRWSTDGGVLYFVAANTLIAASVSTDGGFRVTARAPRFEITDFDFNAPNYDVHPNGEDFVVISQGSNQGARGLVWIQNWTEILRQMATGR